MNTIGAAAYSQPGLGGEQPSYNAERDLAMLSLPALMRRCSAESERYFRGRPSDPRYAYELLRRALVLRDEQAWEQVYVLYSPLVESWVRRSGAFAGSGESSEFFVGAAFTKFWRAMTPERFASFPTLAALLHYLQLCTGSVVIDSVRAQSWAEVVADDTVPEHHLPHYSPDEQALDRVASGEFWRMIDSLLHDSAERAVVHGSFVLGLKPGEIFGNHRDLFGSIGDVYNVKRNVLARLGRNPELRRLA